MQNNKRALQWQIDFSKLGLQHPTVRNMVYPENVTLEGDTLTVTDLPPYQYRVIELQEGTK